MRALRVIGLERDLDRLAADDELRRKCRASSCSDPGTTRLSPALKNGCQTKLFLAMDCCWSMASPEHDASTTLPAMGLQTSARR